MDSRTPRDGRVIEELGYYDPLVHDTNARAVLKAERIDYWLGVGALPMMDGLLRAQEVGTVPLRPGAKAKNVIYLYMSGGMTHLDTFDLKPGAETQGPTEGMKTSADGVLINKLMPKLAAQMKHVAVVNSLTSNQGAHQQGQYLMHTSYVLRGTIKHPTIGSWMSLMMARFTLGSGV